MGVGADLERIKADYGVDGTGAVDVGALAGQQLGVPVGERSLARLVATCLRRHLKKDGVRTSDWEHSPLSDEQVGCDAWRTFPNNFWALRTTMG